MLILKLLLEPIWGDLHSSLVCRHLGLPVKTLCHHIASCTLFQLFNVCLLIFLHFCRGSTFAALYLYDWIVSATNEKASNEKKMGKKGLKTCLLVENILHKN